MTGKEDTMEKNLEGDSVDDQGDAKESEKSEHPVFEAIKHCGNKPDKIRNFFEIEGIPIEIEDSSGMTPLMHACWKGFSDVVQFLIKQVMNDIFFRVGFFFESWNLKPHPFDMRKRWIIWLSNPLFPSFYSLSFLGWLSQSILLLPDFLLHSREQMWMEGITNMIIRHCISRRLPMPWRCAASY